MDKKIEEYRLLKSYATRGIHSRWFLIRSAYDSLNRVQNNQSWMKLDEAQKLDAKCFLQLDIISKMMMYSEDIAVFSWAFLNDKPIYEILDDEVYDLGDRIKEFYEKVDQLSDKEIYKILSYIPEQDITMFCENIREIIVRNMNINAENIKNIIREVGSFGKTNHPFYEI